MATNSSSLLMVDPSPGQLEGRSWRRRTSGGRSGQIPYTTPYSAWIYDFSSSHAQKALGNPPTLFLAPPAARSFRATCSGVSLLALVLLACSPGRYSDRRSVWWWLSASYGWCLHLGVGCLHYPEHVASLVSTGGYSARSMDEPYGWLCSGR